ncbi:hypothetical protein [Amycolatopsis sp. RTGN1]|uniref:hypothetical protein n=1 Tax=Amycolatopsis ponsaeliensis TaxID=2992142 RepID=UPI002549CF3E|nr:hypothetical protein [Amycolatopsis sp. RTGN1]
MPAAAGAAAEPSARHARSGANPPKSSTSPTKRPSNTGRAAPSSSSPAAGPDLYDDDTGTIYLDPDIGALHEPCSGPLYLGHLKTDESERTISLPPFLARLLRWHLTTHNHRQVFVTPNLEWHRRSNFSRRAFRPAADGNLHIANPAIRVQPAKPGLTFHGLRHSHKTWMIDDGIPEIAQALRLGHVLQDKVQETYSHIAAAVEQRLLESLQARWDKAVADSKAGTEGALARMCVKTLRSGPPGKLLQHKRAGQDA